MDTANKSRYVGIWETSQEFLIKTTVFLIFALFATISTAENKSKVLDIQHWTTKNGVRVYFTPTNQVPIVDVTIAFDAGSNRDGEHLGLAKLTNTLLSQGSGKLNATEIAEQFEDVAASFSSASSRDMASLSLRSLNEPAYLNQAIENFALVLSSPSFPEVAVEREKRQQLAAITARGQSPNSIASDAFFHRIFANTPYANSSLGTKTTVEKITNQNIKDFYQQYYVANNAVMAIVGALTKEQAVKMAEQISEQLPAGQKAKPIAEKPSATEAATQRISFPATQAVVYMGQPSIDYHSPDFYTLRVANYPLGGDPLTSRLAEEIREKRGYTYSIYSGFAPMEQTGSFSLNFATRQDQADEAIKVVKNILSEYIQKGPTDEELKQAKQNLTGSFILKFENNRKLLNLLMAIGYYQLPVDYLDTYVEKINAVTKEEIIAALQRHLAVDEMVTIRVG